MDNIRIGRRLLLGFGAIVALTVLLGTFSLQRYAALQGLNENMAARDLTAMSRILELQRTEEQLRGIRTLALLSAFLRKERLPAEPVEVLRRRYMNARDANAKILTELESSTALWEAGALTSQRSLGWRSVRAVLGEVRRAFSAISPDADAMFDLTASGELPQAAARNAAAEQASTAYEERLGEAQRAIQNQTELGRAELEAAAQETQRSVILVLITTLTLGVVLAFLIQRSIAVPLRGLGTVVELIGQGDLTQQFGASRRDEIGELSNTLDRMVKGLKAVAAQTRSVGENLNSATAEILASTQQQAASTAEQAAAVQQANATMAEISQSGAQIADRARQVASAAENASSASTSGLKSVRGAVAAMENIREQAEAVAGNVVTLSEKTQAVGDIITSVNEIAEQSHLLAVNAAIQAAVAGEHGRSFSVVADEMKNLAGRSKDATVQVRSILGDIQKGITSSVMLTEEAVKRVESGRQQVGVAERTIRELTESIEESIRAFQQIVAGSGQQQIGFEQVTQAFRNIGIATQQTAASTKQMEKAASNLNSLAMQLRESVERYRI